MAKFNPSPGLHIGVKAEAAYLRGKISDAGKPCTIAGHHEPGKAYARKGGVAQGRSHSEALMDAYMEISHGNSPCPIIKRKRKKAKVARRKGDLSICAY